MVVALGKQSCQGVDPHLGWGHHPEIKTLEPRPEIALLNSESVWYSHPNRHIYAYFLVKFQSFLVLLPVFASVASFLLLAANGVFLKLRDPQNNGWLVVWLPSILFSHINWVSNHPNWRTHIFQRGGPGPPTRWVLICLCFNTKIVEWLGWFRAHRHSDTSGS